MLQRTQRRAAAPEVPWRCFVVILPHLQSLMETQSHSASCIAWREDDSGDATSFVISSSSCVVPPA
eukprot:3311741-Rhodomonas_salina.6